MKKTLAALLIAAAFATPAYAAKKTSAPAVQHPSYIRCAIWLPPARGCTMDERIIGGAILTALAASGVGWALGGQVWTYAGVGAGTGAVAPLVIR